ncbi:unnamed protein product, partial [Amoebophrya sp. A25]
ADGNCRSQFCLRQCRVDPGPFHSITALGQGSVQQLPNFCATNGGGLQNGQSCTHPSMCTSGFCSSFARQCHQGSTNAGFGLGDVAVMTE